MKKLTLFIILSAIYLVVGAQEACELNKNEWRQVQLFLSDTVKVDYNLIKAKCDVLLPPILRNERTINTLDDLTEKEIESLKKRAAKFKCCSIVLDIKVYDRYINIGGGGYRYQF